MRLVFRDALIALAILAGVAIAVNAILRLNAAASIVSLISDISGDMPFNGNIDTADSCYPFHWQKVKREKLRALLEKPQKPPTATDELGLAQYARYAMNPTVEGKECEAMLREGMRRDPNNALYHYLLADHLLKEALTGDDPKRDKKTDLLTYDYRVKDRALLDEAMREVAIGLDLPYRSWHAAVLRAQLAAMPKSELWEDRTRQISVMASLLLPEFSKFRKLEWVNSYYLSLLLAEEKRTEAEPFLHTGEKLAVQIANDNPPTLIGMLVTMAISKIASNNDAEVCRRHGLPREADEIQRRHKVLMGKALAWKDGIKNDRDQMDEYYRKYAGIMAGILLPIMGKQEWITPEAMAPGRLVESVLLEEVAVSALSLVFTMLLLLAGIKYLRRRLTSRDIMFDTECDLSSAGWMRAIGLGYLLPLALYIMYCNIPMLSGRDESIRYSTQPFTGGVLAFMLWVLIVPASIAANEVWFRNRDEGMVQVTSPFGTLIQRAVIAVASFAWAGFGVVSILLWPILFTLSLVMTSPSPIPVDWATAPVKVLPALLLLALPLLPLIWERKHSQQRAAHHLRLSSALLPVYAVLVLLTGSLLPVLVSFERHYLAADTVMRPMIQDDIIAFTAAEGRLVLQLREYINDGAAQLGLPVR